MDLEISTRIWASANVGFGPLSIHLKKGYIRVSVRVTLVVDLHWQSSNQI